MHLLLHHRIPCPFRTAFCYSAGQSEPSSVAPAQSTVKFKTYGACKLGISNYPDFEYNADGGSGSGIAKPNRRIGDGEIDVEFDVASLYIPPLSSATTRFLGLPLPPFLRIDIVPEELRGTVDQESGKVDLKFKARFCFSAGGFYRARPLLVETNLTSEESKGAARGGKGKRMNGDGECVLIGVARVEPVNGDVFLNTFLGLPTECLAALNAIVSFSVEEKH